MKKKIFFYEFFSIVSDRIIYGGKNLINSDARSLNISVNGHRFFDISDKLFELEALFGSVDSACCLSKLHRPQYQSNGIPASTTTAQQPRSLRLTRCQTGVTSRVSNGTSTLPHSLYLSLFPARISSQTDAYSGSRQDS